MWNWINCYLSGRHDYGVRCEPGAIFLHCLHCGRRSSGWLLEERAPTLVAPTAQSSPLATGARPALKIVPRPSARILPFDRAAS
jgi:hypothetical protein